MTPEHYALIQAMRKYGGSFVRALAECLATADAVNTARLLEAFPDLVATYRQMAAHDQEAHR